MSDTYERISRETVYKGHIVNFCEDTVKLPNGKTVKWDFIAHKGAAAILPVMEDGRILLVRQFRNAIDRMTWEIPAGGRNFLEDGSLEPYIDCAHRELEEETGYKTDKANLEFLVSLKMAVAYCEEQIDVFIADHLCASKQNLDEDELIDVKAFSLDEIQKMIFDGTMQDTKTISAVMAYKAKKNL